MADMTRRNVIQGTLAGLSAVGVGGTLPALAVPAKPLTAGFRLCELWGNPQASEITIAKQIGVTHVIAGGGLRGRKEDYVAAAQKMKDSWEAVGMKVVGVEGHPTPFEGLKAGTETADAEIEQAKWGIEALSKAGINMICYNFMAGLGWTRTNTRRPERGGALTSEFDASAPAMQQPIPRYGEISEEKMWANITKYLKEVIPVADKFKVKMALHPDDPPMSPLRGIARICTSAKNYRRIMDIVPSPMNGVTFCQGNFVLMGEDVYSLAADWCRKKKIFFIHFRDVEGNKQKFHETFHDNGPTDMARMLQIYSKNGFDGPIRPDHAPALASDNVGDRGSSGYTMGAKVLAFGYMRGIMEGMKLPFA